MVAVVPGPHLGDDEHVGPVPDILFLKHAMPVAYSDSHPTLYRVTRQLESYMMLPSILGVPSACGPLLQLASAQAARGNPQIDVNRI